MIKKNRPGGEIIKPGRAGNRRLKEKSADFHETKEKLQASEERIRSILQIIPDIIIELNAEGEYLAVHTAADELLIKSRQEMIGNKISDIMPSESAEVFLQGLRRAIRTGNLQSVEYELQVQAGKRYFEARLVAQGRERALAFIRDISERKLAEESLRESEEKHRLLFETMSPGVIYQEADGRITSANPSAERILGLSLSQMQGKTSMDPRWKMIDENGVPVPGSEHPAMIALKTGRKTGPLTRAVYIPEKDDYVWLSITAIPLFRPGAAKPHQVYATFDDISERRRAEAELLESNRRLESFLEISRRITSSTEQSEIMQLIVDHATRVMNIDSGAVYLLNDQGMLHLEATTPALPENFPEEMRAAVLDDHPHIKKAASTGLHVVMPDIRTADLSPAEKSVVNLRNLRSNLYLPIRLRGLSIGVLILSSIENKYDFSEEAIILLRGFADQAAQIIDNLRNYQQIREQTRVLEQEIIDREQAEAALRESENRIKSIFRTAPIGIGMVSNRILKEANPRLCQISGYSQAELIDRSARMLYPDDEEFEYVGREKYRQISEQGTGTVETKWKRKDGVLINVLLSSTPIDLNDLSRGVTFTALDITASKQAEEEREKLQSQLTQAQKMESVGRLAGGIAHDFNNMLSVILGRAELALDLVRENEPLHAGLKEIQKAARHSADLTRQLLAFARRQTITPRVLDLNSNLAEMLSMLKRLVGENIAIEWKPGRDIWPVKMDPAQLNQIIANLCVNSRDAIDDTGRISIETSNCTFDREYCSRNPDFLSGDFVRLTVGDNGCGMDEQTLSHLFEPFFTTKEVGQGTGLGLATIYGAVRQNQGFIIVNSEPGRGTSFSIYLPRHQLESVAPQRTETSRMELNGSGTILLVEDEPAILSMTKMMLEQLGYSVLAAHTPVEAMRLAEKFPGSIDLLMTDVIMPEMNGRKLAANLQAVYPDLACLFMSGYTADVIADHGVLAAGVHFIQKPFSIKDLGQIVHQALQRDRRMNHENTDSR